MKRDVRIVGFGHCVSTATITNSVDGLTVTNKNPSHDSDDFFIRNFISDSINMDSWKHSMHVSVGNAQATGSEERRKIQAILDEKIASRLDDIKRLKDTKIILSRWKYKYG